MEKEKPKHSITPATAFIAAARVIESRVRIFCVISYYTSESFADKQFLGHAIVAGYHIDAGGNSNRVYRQVGISRKAVDYGSGDVKQTEFNTCTSAYNNSAVLTIDSSIFCVKILYTSHSGHFHINCMSGYLSVRLKLDS